MELYLAVTPDRLAHCPAGARAAHMAFRADRQGRLLWTALPPALHGGVMLVECAAPFPAAAAPALAREIMGHCLRRSFTGVVTDGMDSPSPARQALVRELGALCRRYGRQLYVPPWAAPLAPQGKVVLCTALSGGTLRQHLQEAAEQYGPGRLALDLQRLMMVFPLPCPTGEGTALERPQLEQLAQGRSVYFSEALCARYFTCRQGGQTRFVLFDDGDTLRRKVELAGQLGIREGFFMWPEVEDIVADIFP